MIGSQDTRYIAQLIQPQRKDGFWLQGTPTTPVYSTSIAIHPTIVNSILKVTDE